MTLDRPAIEDPIPVAQWGELLQSLWHDDTSLSTFEDLEPWAAYMRYYTAECRKSIEYQGGEWATIRKHQDIIDVARNIKAGKTRVQITQPLTFLDTQQRSLQVKERMAEGSLRLVVRLVSMIDIGPPSHNRVRGAAPLSWEDADINLQRFLAGHFSKSSTDSAKMKFVEEFTAFNIQRFAGLKIRWTSNLADHLRLVENDTKICIFHHATFLRQQKDSIFPPGFIEETLHTLNLLFPPNDRRGRKFLQAEYESNTDSVSVDIGLLRCNRLLTDERWVEKFEYWRDELLTLKEKFDEPRPTSITQFWVDRRNKVQWYTFWIAVLVLILTILFGVVQSIEGGMQVYKAYHPS